MRTIIKQNDEVDKNNSSADLVDTVPNIGEWIGKAEDLLNVKLRHGDHCGRRKLQGYVRILDDKISKMKKPSELVKNAIDKTMTILRRAAYADVMWDEIVEITRIKDPKEYVYDFTIPESETFATMSGLLVHNTLNTLKLRGEKHHAVPIRALGMDKQLESRN